ncbi:hypothetical protein [Candidatus Marithrix sp. Canyon 246]|nr:hypothetical protein [Candidatus Marithrix sp. Canyon 246]
MKIEEQKRLSREREEKNIAFHTSKQNYDSIGIGIMHTSKQNYPSRQKTSLKNSYASEKKYSSKDEYLKWQNIPYLNVVHEIKR